MAQVGHDKWLARPLNALRAKVVEMKESIVLHRVLKAIFRVHRASSTGTGLDEITLPVAPPSPRKRFISPPP